MQTIFLHSHGLAVISVKKVPEARHLITVSNFLPRHLHSHSYEEEEEEDWPPNKRNKVDSTKYAIHDGIWSTICWPHVERNLLLHICISIGERRGVKFSICNERSNPHSHDHQEEWELLRHFFRGRLKRRKTYVPSVSLNWRRSLQCLFFVWTHLFSIARILYPILQ